RAEDDARFLAADATAVDAAKLGGSPATAFELKADTATFLGRHATADDAGKLAGRAPSGYATLGGSSAAPDTSASFFNATHADETVDSPTPDLLIGSVTLFAGNFPPTGWTFADGQTMAISQNTALFSILGTMYGGNGTTTFQLPDLRGLGPRGLNYVIA